jgi:formylmethanofuran dehydrogenase subunit E
MATTDTSGTDENPADTDSSIGYTKEHTDDTFAEIGHACIEMKDHGDAAVSVGRKGDSDIVSLTVQQSQMMRVSSYMTADTAEWLADQLQEHAEKVRQAGD